MSITYKDLNFKQKKDVILQTKKLVHNLTGRDHSDADVKPLMEKLFNAANQFSSSEIAQSCYAEAEKESVNTKATLTEAFNMFIHRLNECHFVYDENQESSNQNQGNLFLGSSDGYINQDDSVKATGKGLELPAPEL